MRFVSFEPLLGVVGRPALHGVHWAIVGGESGPQTRLVERVWVEEIRAACQRYGTAFFFKQWGGRNKKATGRLLDGRTWDEYPAAPPGGAHCYRSPCRLFIASYYAVVASYLQLLAAGVLTKGVGGVVAEQT